MTLRRKLLLLSLGLALALWCFWPKPPALLPDTLTGVWVSDDSRFADRFLRLERSSVAFGVGGVEVDVHFVTDVEVVEDATSTQYLAQMHRVGEDETPLTLVVDRRTGTLSLLNRPDVRWRRADS